MKTKSSSDKKDDGPYSLMERLLKGATPPADTTPEKPGKTKK